MSVILRDYSDPGRPQLIEASIVPLNRAKHISRSQSWKPILHTFGEEDAEWDWLQWLADADQNQREGKGQYESFALVTGQELQALMLIELTRRRSRESGLPLVYVEYVSVAPFNRRTIQRPPRFGGCGTGIISMAIERSQALGYGGKIGLHSLPRAVEAYEKMGMKNFGLDPLEQLHYFES